MECSSRSNEYGICRCCLTKGNHRNILKEYVFEGAREVYIEMFMDCLNLFLSTDTSVSQLICSKCIQKLREAKQFRIMVADAEKKLFNVNNQLDTEFVNVPSEESSQTPVKRELESHVKLEQLSDDDGGFDTEYICPEDLMAEHDTTNNTLIPGEAALLARCSTQDLELPTKASLHRMCPQYAEQLELLKHMTVTSQIIKMRLNQTHKAPSKGVFVSEKLAHITNAKTLIQCSNLTPFKSKTRCGFPCFYCRDNFEDLHKLRQHSCPWDRKSSEIYRILKQAGTESLIVYADVTDLKCNLCDKNMQNITELKSHLVKEHQKKIYTQVSDRVIPYKMKGNQFECQICTCNFETFGAVERHMNGHYRNYVCKDCGSGFITKYRLKVHSKSMHVDGNHPCEFCGKVFSTQQKYKNHVNAVHKQVKRFKCAKCSVRFTEYFKRQRHMEEIHGVTPLKYKCNVCERAFDRKYTLSRHLKRDHLEERDYQCEICAYKCFTKNELKVHMVKHNGERIFECSVCKKSYARKKTLREHMRIHNNDRRFSCAVCGQAFVQKCSLKGHIKTHHFSALDADGKWADR